MIRRQNELGEIAVSNNVYTHPFDNAKGQYAKQALGIDSPLFLLNPDAALEFIGLLDEECGRPRTEPDLVHYNDFLNKH